jgi:hypothetical protein
MFGVCRSLVSFYFVLPLEATAPITVLAVPLTLKSPFFVHVTSAPANQDCELIRNFLKIRMIEGKRKNIKIVTIFYAFLIYRLDTPLFPYPKN